MSKARLCDLTMQIHIRADRAVLASMTGDKREAVWLPLSQIEINDVTAGQIATITMPEWLATEKELV
jgi:hypothetical protein